MDDNRMREYPPYGNEMRYERMEDERMREENIPENRRRRDSRGRFMEQEEMPTSHYDEGWYGRGENQDHQNTKQTNIIGFKMKQNKNMNNGKLDFERARKWVESVGEHFPMEKTKTIMQHVGAEDCNPIEFWAVINSLYSDYAEVMKKYNMDVPDVYGALTKAWLKDDDAVENKAAEYLECIVKQ